MRHLLNSSEPLWKTSRQLDLGAGDLHSVTHFAADRFTHVRHAQDGSTRVEQWVGSDLVSASEFPGETGVCTAGPSDLTKVT